MIVRKAIVTSFDFDSNLETLALVANLLELKGSGIDEVIVLTNNELLKDAYYESEFNRAIDAKRSVGSTLKPFLYYEALESGFTPSTTFTSERTTFVFSENQVYSPKNYGNLYAEDEITLASAISFIPSTVGSFVLSGMPK